MMEPDCINDRSARTEAEKSAYRDRYGCDWETRWYEHISGTDRGYDVYHKDLNTMLYRYGRNTMWGPPEALAKFRADLEVRRREVYGDRYEELTRFRVNRDPRVAELLIQEAARTGKWKELPDELQCEYGERFDPSIHVERMSDSVARIEAEKSVYRDRYGDGWEQKWYARGSIEALGYDPDRKHMNEDIYHHGRSCFSVECFVRDLDWKHMGERICRHGRSGVSRKLKTVSWFHKVFDMRLHEVYGNRYDELVRNRVDNDPRVAELLIQEAIRTGKWEELPDELRLEYYERRERFDYDRKSGFGVD